MPRRRSGATLSPRDSASRPAPSSWRRAAPAALPAAEAKRIIVVDDNADGAVTLAHLLEILGHQATALVELARLFRADAQLKDCHLVALTAMDGLDYGEMIRQAGFDAHIRKPADMALLRSIIAQFQDR